FTDHFPVYARFNTKPFKYRDAPSRGNDALREELALGYETGVLAPLKNGAFLNDLTEAQVGAEMGKVFAVEAEVAQRKPLRLSVDGVEWSAYIHNRELYGQVMRTKDGKPLDLVVTLGVYRGNRQFIVEGIR
ncbi:MAG: hypothetical protein ACPGES_02105, partial [Coraliomargarita sp.]